MAPPIMKYDLIYHSKSSRIGPSPPNRFSKSGCSATYSLSIVNQCPGGVSESGPSAQNSATTLAKSPLGTTLEAYAWPVTGFTGCPSALTPPSN